jgi:hypothetical protein
MYYAMSTLLTIGYGDIVAQSIEEKLFSMLLMCLGILSFSFATGTISSIIQSYDHKEAALKEKITTLNQIQKQYSLDVSLFNKLAQTIKYDFRKGNRDVSNFVEELPHKLKVELSLVIHQQMYQAIHFFKDKEKCFLSWIVPLLKPYNA